MTDIDHFFCTDCGGGGLVAVADDRDLLFCAACEKYFEIPPEHRDGQSRDSTDDRADELDGLRIKQLATMRRAAYRSRSHAVVACIVCTVACVQLIVMTIANARHRSISLWPIVTVALIPISIFGTFYFYRRAVQLHREATERSSDEQNAPPDFSRLGNGSDRWKQLDDVR